MNESVDNSSKIPISSHGLAVRQNADVRTNDQQALNFWQKLPFLSEMSQDIFLTTIVRFLSIFAGFFTSILTAHFLGPAGRGDYFFVTTLAMMITQFAQLGLASSNTYLVASNLSLLRGLFVNSLWISLVVGMVCSALVLWILRLTTITYPAGSWVVLFLVPVSIFYLLGGNLLVGINKMRAYNVLQASSHGLLMGCMLVAGIVGTGVYGFLMGSLIGWLLVTAMLVGYLLHLTQKDGGWRFDWLCFERGAGYGCRAYIITGLGLLVLKGNIFLLKMFSTHEMLGYYSIASQLNDCLVVLPASVGLVLFPQLVRQKQKRRLSTKKYLAQISLVMTSVCFIAAILAKPLIGRIFGVDFLPAVTIFYWMLPGTVCLSVITILSQYFAAIGFPRALILAWLMSLLIALLAGWYFVPSYGGQGAAMGLSLAYFILLLLMSWMVYHNWSEN